MEYPSQLDEEFNTALQSDISASGPLAKGMDNPPLQMEKSVSKGVIRFVCAKFSPYHDAIFHS